MRILVVDDSASVRARLVALLVREVPGASVYQARDGDEALDLARVERVHVVILDLHLPGKSGLEVLSAMKAIPSPPRVLVLTGDPSEHLRRACLANGAAGFLDKSTEFARLPEIVRSDTRVPVV